MIKKVVMTLNELLKMTHARAGRTDRRSGLIAPEFCALFII